MAKQETVDPNQQVDSALENAAARRAELETVCKQVMQRLAERAAEPKFIALRYSKKGIEHFIEGILLPYTKKSAHLKIHMQDPHYDLIGASEEFGVAELLSNHDGFSWFIKVIDDGTDITFVIDHHVTTRERRELTQKPLIFKW